MKKQKKNDTSIYCLSSGAALPEWLGDRAKRNLSKRDESIRRRIELLQDFQMPSSSSKLIQSADGRYIIAAGTYPPRIRCFDVDDLSMKFERYVDADIIDAVMLGEDYGKIGLLRSDRVVDFHAPYGHHESIRIPASGRGMAFESTTCELMIAAKGNNVFRLNLEEGRFTEPLAMDVEASSSCIAIAPTHPLAAIGGDDGVVRLIDSRNPSLSRKPCLRLDVHRSTARGTGSADILGGLPSKEITSVAFDPNGLYMAGGTAGGLAAVYDVRSSHPLVVQEHKNRTSILAMKFHANGKIITMDEKLVKIWRYKTPHESLGAIADGNNNIMQAGLGDTGSVVVNVEGTGKFSDFIMAGDESDPEGYTSGILLCACDQPKIESYYMPKVGQAPRWCSFLENITEELEEEDLARQGGTNTGLVHDGNETIFENYKFVSRDDVGALGITNLIGTPLLRGYMHGFFMDANLYNRVKAVANPFAYEEYRKKKLKERLEAKRSSRIAPQKDNKKLKAPINSDLAKRLESKAGAVTGSGHNARNLLGDERFGSLFTDPDFEIDQQDEMFKLRNPSGVAAPHKGKQEEDYDSESERSLESEAEAGNDSWRGGKKLRTLPDKPKERKKPIVYETGDLEGISSGGRIRDSKQLALKSRKMDLPIAPRVAQQGEISGQITEVKNRFGAKEAVYVPKGSRKKDSDDAGTANEQPSRRKRSKKV